MSLPRVLLVEDDPSIRRFVELAWDDQPIELLQAASLAEALDLVHRAGPFRLVITDLMLPDGSGLQLLQALASDTALRAEARVAVFSAGLSAERRADLDGLGVDEVIAKPAALAQLVACLERSLTSPVGGQGPAPQVFDHAVERVVEHYFAGDHGLYDSYRASCLRQFAVDRRTGDAALASGDLPALRRLAHSLKTVLLTLGHEGDSALARQLECDAAQGMAMPSAAGWQQLAQSLSRLASPQA